MTPKAFHARPHARPSRAARACLAVRAAVAVALLLAAPTPAPARAGADDADLCLLAALDAHRLSGVPLSVLLAVSLTETGRGPPGAARPWPWTVNADGEGHWFATRAEAVAFAEARLAAGATSFDVGCFQLNWRWHGENFVSVDQMFDPLANASYAAGFLQTVAAEGGTWSEVAGAYHSRTPEYASRYRRTFDAHLAAAEAAGVDGGANGAQLAGAFAPAGAGAQVAQADAPDLAPRANAYPLLRAGAGAGRLGSLVPLGDG